MAMKYGYENIQDYKNGVQEKFSLLELGILDMPSTRLLLINVSSFLRWLLGKYTYTTELTQVHIYRELMMG